MTSTTLPTGPDPEAITHYILGTWPETDMVEIPGGQFFSLDPEKHWPNYATLVTNDDFDQASDIVRPGVFRLNMGVSRETFEALVGSLTDPDFRAFDQLLPHPVYAKQLWVSILNPSDATFEHVVKPLLAEAHDRLAAARARHGAGQHPTDD